MSPCELHSGELSVCLDGTQRAAGLRAFRRLCPAGPDERRPQAVETLELALEGPQAAAARSQIEAVLARLQAGYPGHISLAAADGSPFSSPLLAGSSERLGPYGLPDGSHGLRLRLIRAPYWEGEPSALTLRSPQGETAAGLPVTWRADQPFSANWALLSLPAELSPLPAPLKLEVINDRPGALALGPLWVCSAGGQPPYGNAHLLEGESGVPGPGMTVAQAASSSCSGGAYRTFTWSQGGLQRLNSWSFTAHQQQAAAGLPLRLGVRLAAACPLDIWLSLRLCAADGSLLASAEPGLLPAGETLALLPALTVPAGLASGAYVETAELWGEAASFPASLALDCACLLPCEAVRACLPRASTGCPSGWTLVDDPVEGLYGLDPSTGLRSETHAAAGSPLTGWPGEQQRLGLLWGQPGGGSSVSQQLRLRAVVRPRRSEV